MQPANKIAGAIGEQRSVLVEMKTIADIGLVGYPNVGPLHIEPVGDDNVWWVAV